MARTLYELVGKDDRRFSPNCWRTRYALAHKGLEAEYVPCAFTEKDKIAFSGAKTYPVLQDGEEAVADSWQIACYLEDQYPERPSLFGGPTGRGTTAFVNAWANTQLHPALIRTVIYDIFEHLTPGDAAYFRESRERRFGVPLEALRDQQDERVETLRQTLTPVRDLLGRQPWICGEAPAYGDYVVFSAFQWARCISPRRLLADDDPVREWRARMIGLFDGLADTTPCYAAA